MNVLYLCHRLPYPPDKGEKIRAFHFIRSLSARHSLHLACVADGPEDLEAQHELERSGISVVAVPLAALRRRVSVAAALVSRRPLSTAAFWSRRLSDAVGGRLKDGGVDVIVAQSAAMAEYVRNAVGTPRVMDFVDLDSEKFRTYAERRGFPWNRIFALEAERLGRYEGEIGREFDAAIFISDREAELFEARFPGVRTTVIPNGVDLDHFRPTPDTARASNAVVFTGVMDYYPNVDAVLWFVDAVLPRIRRDLPGTEVLVVGRTPATRIARLREHPAVTVTGAVPDTRPWLARAKVAIAPFRIARGVQNKVLEAMASGLPVVGTPLAFQGIPATDGDGVFAADEPESLARAIVRLLGDDALRIEQGRRARRLAEREFPWDVHAGRMEALLTDLTARASEGALR